MDEIILAAKLSELRRAKGITQEQVASSLNVSNKTISKWENGSSTPELSMLAALAKYYGVTTDTLLDLEDGTRDTKRVIMDEFSGLDRDGRQRSRYSISSRRYTPPTRKTQTAQTRDLLISYRTRPTK